MLDDFGIQPFDQVSRSSLLEIIEDRHGKRSTIITSQLPIKPWYEVIGEKTVADAFMDRILNNAKRIRFNENSNIDAVTNIARVKARQLFGDRNVIDIEAPC